MIGYSRERVGYRLFDLERNVILEERNVIFDESVKGGFLLNKLELGNIMTTIGISRIFLRHHIILIKLLMITD